MDRWLVGQREREREMEHGGWKEKDEDGIFTPARH